MSFLRKVKQKVENNENLEDLQLLILFCFQTDLGLSCHKRKEKNGESHNASTFTKTETKVSHQYNKG